jgi:tRNA-uridine 2-sulfurtransferase
MNLNTKNKKVVVGLSGGVDSSVSAALLIEQGYEVIGLFMKNWHDETVTISNECPWVEDSNDALLVAEKLGIPFQNIDLSEPYKKKVVDYMFNEYQNGRTPNPDVLCNREIKFDVFLDTALKLGADFVATGHYCQKAEIEENGNKIYRLIEGADKNKDQSYFLCQLSQQQLSKAIFPIGHLQKSEVRKIAEKYDLITANKKDSQGICFVGKVKLPDFLKQQLEPKKGEVIEIANDADIYKNNIGFKYSNITINDAETIKKICKPYFHNKGDGKKIGNHNGAHYYTVGQRKGLGIGGFPLPLFVIEKDTLNNIIYLGQGENHPGLNRKGLKISNEEIHWLREDLKLNIGETAHYDCRIRYRQPKEKCQLFMLEDGLYIVFENNIQGIASGQFAAWYKDEELIGSGVIN